jgi:hypothetical protein
MQGNIFYLMFNNLCLGGAAGPEGTAACCALVDVMRLHVCKVTCLSTCFAARPGTMS